MWSRKLFRSAGPSPLLVLGMHRSGTSAVSGALVCLGACAPKTLIPSAFDNVRGFWESDVIRALNDEILASAGRAWNDWREFDRDWYATSAAVAFRRRMRRALSAEFPGAILPVIKDPRICRLVPLWSTVLKELAWRPTILLVLRSPVEVAASLHARDCRMGATKPISLSDGCLLWLRHVLDAEANSRNLPRALIVWNSFLDNWHAELERVQDQTGIRFPNWSDNGFRQVSNFLSPHLRHHQVPSGGFQIDPKVNEWIRETYLAACELSEHPARESALRSLDQVRVQVDGFSSKKPEQLAASIDASDTAADHTEARRPVGVQVLA
ncbi:MAG TPA: hypothetical protein VE999_03665 [Gemmataceae bacterium]|nr:hypothetical protein [Gemmataceae bacterium]